MGDLSFDERRRLVSAAITQARGSDCYIAELYDDRAIYECYGDGADAGKSFEIPYTIADDQEVTLGDRTEVVRETTYRAVKFVGKDTIEGLAIPFGGTFAGKDLHGETFDAKTDLCIDWFGDAGRPVLYDHGLDNSLKASVIGRQTEFETRAEGVWAQSQLDLNAKYRKAVDKLIEAESLGYSSGAMPHLATKNSKTGVITRWPWVELSLTPIPAEPSTLGVHYTKSAAEALAFLEAVDLDIPAPLKAALAALDEWADNRDDEGLPAGLKFAEHADRLLADVEAFRERAGSLVDLRSKSGRALSAPTRERLARHPMSLRELADDFDALLADAGATKAMKADAALLDDVAETLRRAALIDHPEGVLN